jgi:hypothetical protein
MSITGPSPATRFFVVTGVAILNFPGLSTDWTRDDVHFFVPQEGETLPVEGGGVPLNVGTGIKATMVAFPATITSSAGDAVGWGVDSTQVFVAGGGGIEAHAQVAVNNTVGQIIRMGFQVNILAQ